MMRHFFFIRAVETIDCSQSASAQPHSCHRSAHPHLVPLNDLVDIGVQDANGKYLYLQKQKISDARQEFTVTVDKLPIRAGVDPLIKLIDRNPLVAVAKQ